MTQDETLPTARRPGLMAAALAAAAPPIAAATVILNVAILLRGVPAGDALRSGALWLQILVWIACSAALSALLWRGLRRGRFSPLPLLAIAAVPWIVGILVTRAALLELGRSGAASLDMVLAIPAEVGVPGLLATWALAGSVGFALAVAALAGRAGPPRALDVVAALASLIPLIALVVWHVVAADLSPPWLDAGLLGLALLSAPVVIGLAAASPPVGDPASPAHRWRLGVALALALGFSAAASVVYAAALVEASGILVSVGDADALPMIQADIAHASRFRWIGAALALLPAIVFAVRSPARSRAAATVGAAALALAGLFLANALSQWMPMGGPEDLLRSYAAEPSSVEPDPALAPAGKPADGNTPREIVIPKPMTVPTDLEGIEGGIEGGIPGGVVGGVAGGVVDAPPPPPPAGPDVAAVVLHRANPVFPREALQAGERGLVIVEVDIDEAGAVTGTTVLRSASPPLDEAAIAAARQTRFRPALRNGRPVASDFVLTYNFVSQ